MARPRETGLRYFPLDCKFDRKIKTLRSRFGNDGLAVLITTWQEVYQTPDGILDISDEGVRAMLAEDGRVDLPRWEEIIHVAAGYDLFDKEELEAGRLTSNGIKKRYAEVCKDRKRKRGGDELVSPPVNPGITHGETLEKPPINPGITSEEPRNNAGNGNGNGNTTTVVAAPVIRSLIPSEEDVVAHAGIAGVDTEFARDWYALLLLSGWLDGDGKPIQVWHRYLGTCWLGKSLDWREQIAARRAHAAVDNQIRAPVAMRIHSRMTEGEEAYYAELVAADQAQEVPA